MHELLEKISHQLENQLCGSIDGDVEGEKIEENQLSLLAFVLESTRGPFGTTIALTTHENAGGLPGDMPHLVPLIQEENVPRNPS